MRSVVDQSNLAFAEDCRCMVDQARQLKDAAHRPPRRARIQRAIPTNHDPRFDYTPCCAHAAREMIDFASDRTRELENKLRSLLLRSAVSAQELLHQFVTADFLMSGNVSEDRSEERRVGKECRSRW